MEKQILQKARKLQKILKEMGSVLIAFSGGTDSTLVLKFAVDNLSRENILAAIALSPIFPIQETRYAQQMATSLGAPFKIVKTDEMMKKDFTLNEKNHCYICKHSFFSTLARLARKNHLSFVIDGTNYDDLKENRSSFKALKELSIRHPLAEARLRKSEIRKLSKHLGLPTWNKLPQPCFASRISLGIEITLDNIERIKKAEDWLKDQGFEQPIVRLHPEGLVRLKLGLKDARRCLNEEIREKITKKFKKLGFSLVTLALEIRDVKM